jgi:hypothetical protein
MGGAKVVRDSPLSPWFTALLKGIPACACVKQASSVVPATGSGTGAAKDKTQSAVSFDHLQQCLEAIGQRVETLVDITAGYPAHVVRLGRGW